MSWTDNSRQIRLSVFTHDEAPASFLANIDLQIEIASRELEQRIRSLQLPSDLITVEVW